MTSPAQSPLEPSSDPPSSSAPREDLERWARGSSSGMESDPNALNRLFDAVYRELKAIAARHLAQERINHTLQPTALLHEAYLRLQGMDSQPWQNQSHFFAVASRLIRRILVDHARARGTDKRSGARPGDLPSTIFVTGEQTLELMDLEVALEGLQEIDPEALEVVEMRYFGGLTNREIAEALGTHERAVSRHWSFAKAWLHRELSR